jgi:O-antigen/teichoic acid export membrane protein
MIGFGIRFQAVGLAALARTQGVNLAILAVGGAPLLGYWSLANRLLQVPFWLFQSLWRVSYPTMARLRAFGEDTGRVVVRLARVTALASGAILAPLAASAHSAIPVLFGSAWTSAADPIPWACAGLMVSGPISVATAGYLYSEQDPQTPLTATIVNGVVWISLTILLLGPLGITAAGVAWMAASWGEAGVFTRALRRRADVRVERVIAVPVLFGFASALVAYGVSRTLTGQIVNACITALVALAIFGSLNLLFNRDDVLAVARRVRLLRAAQAV